jgi:predicted CopG family antitoxin
MSLWGKISVKQEVLVKLEKLKKEMNAKSFNEVIEKLLEKA